MEQYKILGRIGEGAHGVVFKAKDILNGNLVAMKKIPLKRFDDSIPNTALREIKALQQIENHENIVQLKDVIPQGMGFMLIFEFMITDLSKMIYSTEVCMTEGELKRYMVMLLKGIAYCHSNHIMHRDLKPANLLISIHGILKIADFGLARVFENNQDRLYSHQVATRWYRAPELLFGARRYTEGVDLWAVGCIFGELLNCTPLFPGETDIEQICCVQRILGSPTQEDWPAIHNDLPDFNKIKFRHFDATPFEQIFLDSSTEAIDLIQKLLVYPTEKRIPAANALLHSYFFTDPLPSPVHCMANLIKGFHSPRKEADMQQILIDVDLPIETGLPPNNILKLWQNF